MKIGTVVGIGLVVVMGIGLAASAMAAEVSASADLSSAYVFRGATFNDGPALQPGLEVSGFPVVEGLSVGVWGNMDIGDYDETLEEGEFSEIDIYGSYDIPLPGELVEMGIGYTEYTYPMGGGVADREVAISAGLAIPLAPSASLSYGVDGGIKDSLYLELGLSQGIEINKNMGVEAGVVVGYMSIDMGPDGFSHYMASLSGSLYMFNASINYVGQIDDDVLPDAELGGPYDVEVFGTLGVRVEF